MHTVGHFYDLCHHRIYHNNNFPICTLQDFGMPFIWYFIILLGSVIGYITDILLLPCICCWWCHLTFRSQDWYLKYASGDKTISVRQFLQNCHNYFLYVLLNFLYLKFWILWTYASFWYLYRNRCAKSSIHLFCFYEQTWIWVRLQKKHIQDGLGQMRSMLFYTTTSPLLSGQSQWINPQVSWVIDSSWLKCFHMRFWLHAMPQKHDFWKWSFFEYVIQSRYHRHLKAC